MRIPIVLILFLLISGCSPSGVPVPLSIQKGLDSILVRWVPDKREGICSFSLKMISSDQIIVKGETNLPEARTEILNYLSRSGIRYTDSLSVLPDTIIVKKKWGIVNVSTSNLKHNPSHSSELVSQAIMGTPVKIMKNLDGWLLVQTPDYYIGWADESGIVELTNAEYESWKKSERLIYTLKTGDVLSVSDNNSVVSDIVAGSILQFDSEKSNFFYVRLPDGRRGKIEKNSALRFSKYCSEKTTTADKMILFAKSCTGTPYLWGGTSTKTCDCSGFTKTIYFTGGVILSRDASLQFLHGQPVDISSSLTNLEAGDLIFFGHLKNGEKKITHVGMYIGDTEVIHSSGMVRINSLDSTRTNFSRHLKVTMMGARRIIGARSERGVEAVGENSWYNISN